MCLDLTCRQRKGANEAGQFDSFKRFPNLSNINKLFQKTCESFTKNRLATVGEHPYVMRISCSSLLSTVKLQQLLAAHIRYFKYKAKF